MDYYSVDFAAGTKLGISVICRSSTQPLLGTTLVESVADKNSFAYVQGIRRGDFLVSVNGHYVSNIAHSKCIDILKSQLEKRIEIRIQLCRPNYFEWQQIRNDMNEIVHEGILQKQSGILKRWSPRYVKVTRETFSYYVDGAMKRKISVGDLRFIKSPYRANSSQFGLIAGGKEMEFDAQDEGSANLWKHAIECAVNRAFDKDLPIEYHSRNRKYDQTHSSEEQVPSSSQPNSTQPLNTSYLNVGKQSPNSAHPNFPPVSGRPNPPNGKLYAGQTSNGAGPNAASNMYKNPYWMLLQCKIATGTGPEGAVFVGNVPNPASMKWTVPEYQFIVEKKVLEKEDS
mmetsp:Transcript_3378/g.4015  ORF Transcript_3378/g.4015 Transcript_3378/m.4015 type:complete len:342 (-) Transcript_3378:1105-2130(-)